MSITNFFLTGEASDEAYKNVRDSKSKECAEANIFTNHLWEKYHPFADSNFQTDARNHFLQRFWEMYLYCVFDEQGLNPRKIGSTGPEFFFMHADKKIWVEAIAPGPGEGADKVLETPSDGKAHTVPTEEILLRFTHAFHEKFKKYQKDLQKGIISPNDYILLCINSRGIPHASFGAEIPYFIKAFLPIGYRQITVDLKSGQIKSRDHEFRDVLEKQSGSRVSTSIFLLPETAPVIGILHSSVDSTSSQIVLGKDFSLLTNPMSNDMINENLLNWCTLFKASLNENHIKVRRIEPNSH